MFKLIKSLFNLLKNNKKLLFALIFLYILIFPNYTIVNNAKNKTFFKTSKIIKNKVGLVLGTTKTLSNGYTNLYFTYRINATVKLFKSGKIDFVLVSGDNGNKGYNEPEDFKLALIKKGIPANKIFLDFAGFRTLDSVIRAKEIFGQKSITIISQKFHNERAIYLAGKNGIKAIGFNAKDVSKRSGLKTNIREYFARTKAFLDVIFNVQSKLLGDKIIIR